MLLYKNILQSDRKCIRRPVAKCIGNKAGWETPVAKCDSYKTGFVLLVAKYDSYKNLLGDSLRKLQRVPELSFMSRRGKRKHPQPIVICCCKLRRL